MEHVVRYLMKYRYAANQPLSAVKRGDVVVDAKSSQEAAAMLKASVETKGNVLVNVDSVKELK